MPGLEDFAESPVPVEPTDDIYWWEVIDWAGHIDLLEECAKSIQSAYKGPAFESEGFAEAMCISEAVVGEHWEANTVDIPAFKVPKYAADAMKLILRECADSGNARNQRKAMLSELKKYLKERFDADLGQHFDLIPDGKTVTLSPLTEFGKEFVRKVMGADGQAHRLFAPLPKPEAVPSSGPKRRNRPVPGHAVPQVRLASEVSVRKQEEIDALLGELEDSKEKP